MKSIFVWLLAFALTLPVLAQARHHSDEAPFWESAPMQQAVYANIGSSAVGLLPALGYERATGSKNSFTLELSGAYVPGVDYSYNEVGLEGSFRWWFAKVLPHRESRALKGVYLGPFAVLRSYNVSYAYSDSLGRHNDSVTGLGFGGGAQGGYQFIFRPGLMLDLGLDLGATGANASYRSGAPAIPLSGAYLASRAEVGWAF